MYRTKVGIAGQGSRTSRREVKVVVAMIGEEFK